MTSIKIDRILTEEIADTDDQNKLEKIEHILLEQLAIVRNKRFKLKQENFQRMKSINGGQ